MRSILSGTRSALTHALPPVIDGGDSLQGAFPESLAHVQPGSETFVCAAGHAGRLLSPAVHDALVDFADQPHRSGALLIKGMPFGDLPPTPPTPTAPTTKDHVSEFTLLTVARRLGQPVGYEPEHGGDLVQNLVPVAASADRQTSTSSKVDLMFHTEAAFHPHRPRFLLLLCLRGDARATTTLASIHELIPHLSQRTRDVLFQPRFRTAIDESYLHGRQNMLGDPIPVLRGHPDTPSMVFDQDLMVGIDEEADQALQTLGKLVEEFHTGLALEQGDLIVVDNDVAVHGRTSFAPRFDGTDRWLQRCMAVTDLTPSATDRRGRVITTVFGA